MPDIEATKIFHISLDAPLEELHVEERYRQVLLVVTYGGSVVAQIWLPALSVIPADFLAHVVAAHAGERIWRRELRETVLRAGRGPDLVADRQPSVAVVVCTRNRTDHLRRCLDSLLALDTRPAEILVVDNAPSDDGTEILCAELPVRYLLEPLPGQSRARNLGIVEADAELIAFTDDDCAVDPRWLDDLARPFADPLTMAVTGYTAPIELETRAQWLFEALGGFPKHFDRVVFDNIMRSPANTGNTVGAGANMVFRRAVFEEIGLFAEDLGPGTPARAADDAYQMYKLLAAGYRVEYDPARIVWHRHRRDDESLRRILYDYGCSSIAYSMRLLIKHREPTALRNVAWWIKHVVSQTAVSLVNRDWLPPRAALAEARGVAAGPWSLLRSKLSRRRIPALRIPEGGLRRQRPPVVVEAEMPELSVVVPSRNRLQQLGLLLDGIARQTYPAERVETIVVLDGSEDDSGDFVRHFEAPYELQLLEHDRVGAATSRNRGTRAASASHVVFIDDDIVPEPDFLAVHAQAQARARDEHLAMGRCPPVVQGKGWWGQALRAWWEDHYRVKAEPGHRWTFIDFDGGNASFPKRMFLDAGGFDEEFHGRREEWELGVRLLERGVRFAYYPEAVGWHHLDTSLETNLRHQRQHGRDDVLLARKHPRLKPQLRLASFFEGLPDTSESLMGYGPPLAGLFEAVHFRRRWARLVDRMLTNAYVLGVADVFPTQERFGAFATSMWDESVETVPFRLDLIGPLPMPSTGSVEFAVRYGPDSYGHFTSTGPAEEWSWDVVGERMLGRIYEGVRRTRLLEELDALVPSAEAPARQEVARVR